MVGCIEKSQELYIIYIYIQQILYIRSSNHPPPQNKNQKIKQNKNKNKNKKEIIVGFRNVYQ